MVLRGTLVGARFGDSADESSLPRHVAVVLGHWPDVFADCSVVEVDAWIICRCPYDAMELTQAICVFSPSWIVFGTGLAEERLVLAASVVQSASPFVKFAVLDDAGDLQRCNRWLERGATVYLRSSVRLDEALQAMSFADQGGVCVIDEWVQARRLARQAQLRNSILGESSRLTKRELQVLKLVRLGMRNSAIGLALSIAEATVEFHVSHILAKLGATSRTQAVQKAEALGLDIPLSSVEPRAKPRPMQPMVFGR